MIYRAKYVLPMTGGVIENGEVLVIGRVIAAIAKNLAEQHPEESVKDLGCCVLMPGFVNAHSHVDYTMSRNLLDGLNLWDWIDTVGFRRGKVPAYELIHASAMYGCAELAKSGVTCLGDSSFSGAAGVSIDQVGLRGRVYCELFGQSMGDRYLEGCAAALQKARELDEKTSERVGMGLSPHSIYTSNIEVLRFCAESGLPVAIHLAETVAERQYCIDGTGPIAEWRHKLGYPAMTSDTTPTQILADAGLLKDGVSLAHCVDLNAEEVAAIGESGACVAHCPRSNAFLGAGIAPISELAREGACIGLGTDSAGSCGELDFFEEMRCALLMGRAGTRDAGVMTAMDILRMATIGGAKSIGFSDIIGVLEPGRRADMIAISLEEMLPGEDLGLAILSRRPSDVKMTMVDGREVISGGKLVRCSSAEIEHKLRGLMERQFEQE